MCVLIESIPAAINNSRRGGRDLETMMMTQRRLKRIVWCWAVFATYIQMRTGEGGKRENKTLQIIFAFNFSNHCLRYKRQLDQRSFSLRWHIWGRALDVYTITKLEKRSPIIRQKGKQVRRYLPPLPYFPGEIIKFPRSPEFTRSAFIITSDRLLTWLCK